MKEEHERTPLRTILQNFLNHIESLEIQRIEDSYEKEFQELKFFSEILKTLKQYSCSEGEKEVNRKKNRYKDILPFDSSRVILSEYAGVPGSDYINANYIKGASGSPAYIACQGPLPHTVNDFWRMVVECEVQVIVMACNEEEAGKHKCENYWVEREGEEKQFGMVTIRLVKASTVCPDFLVRTMRLKYTSSQLPHVSEERTVCQFHYSAWPDHGVPPLVRPLLDMVRLVRDTQASETLPVLVHCSAGCGRTGTICAIDYVWGLLRAGKLNKDFSLYKLVQDMRKQRIAMVQTKEQYVLVHQAVRELFREQLRMIDSHPYENIDANGMPLVKEEQEPMYACPTIADPAENCSEEKQDGKEKEFEEKIPPLPQKKRGHIASSKQEKEVENLTEKQRSIVEQSSASMSYKPRIAKLKALFERSPATRESRSSQSKQRHCQQVSRSHSLGAVRVRTDSQEDQVVVKAEGQRESNVNSPVLCHATVHVPQITTIQGSYPTVRPTLPVKRSKSLKVLGSNQHRKLSLATGVSPLTPLNMSDDMVSSEKNATSVKPADRILSHRGESASNLKPLVPPKKYLTDRSGEVSINEPDVDSSRSSEQDDKHCISQTQLDWMNRYEDNRVVPRRRRSLESVNFEDVAVPGGSGLNHHDPVLPPPQQLKLTGGVACKVLQGSKNYLVSNVKCNVSCDQLEKKVQNCEAADSLTIEAQRKVNAIVAGLGVRERRNSFRQAVGTSREVEARHPRDPIGDKLQHPDERKHIPFSSVLINSSVSQIKGLCREGLEPEQNMNMYGKVGSSNVRLGKLGVQPKHVLGSKVLSPDRTGLHHNHVGTDPKLSATKSASNGFSLSVDASNSFQSLALCKLTDQASESAALRPRKLKNIPNSRSINLKTNSTQENSLQTADDQELRTHPWGGMTAAAGKMPAKEVSYKCSPSSVPCHRNAAGLVVSHGPGPRIGNAVQSQYKSVLAVGGAISRPTEVNSSSHMAASFTQPKKQCSMQEVSYGLVAGVQLRRGSQDDLALCPSPSGAVGPGPNAPSRVRRHASVVLLRRSLAETGGVQANSSISQPSLAVWNSTKQGSGDAQNSHIRDQEGMDASGSRAWLQAPGVDVDTVAASINPQRGGFENQRLSSQPALVVKKQHYF
ncbi:hypothetical protein B7P43_G09096 [Cryptotermes secundus]|uniref:protein-tyrosine-phosphatase n=1 Tax=Cryptotermes secundus TaxID=105785 RepID=A0A2J7PL98_9NEOP|nr:uncharacterized protein LOC111873190 isoform X2 [Cryptotermes secundus]PNF17113.1 hypothetical protein B7P43_G09096 [Cryptotermes secundus]